MEEYHDMQQLIKRNGKWFKWDPFNGELTEKILNDFHFKDERS